MLNVLQHAQENTFTGVSFLINIAVAMQLKVSRSVYIANRSYRFCWHYAIFFSEMTSIKQSEIKNLHSRHVDSQIKQSCSHVAECNITTTDLFLGKPSKLFERNHSDWIPSVNMGYSKIVLSVFRHYWQLKRNSKEDYITHEVQITRKLNYFQMQTK